MIVADMYRAAARLFIPKGQLNGILFLQGAATIIELVGLVALLPVLQYIQYQGDLAALTRQFREWRWLTDIHAAIGLPVTLAGLLGACFVLLVIRQGLTYLRLRVTAEIMQRSIAITRCRMFEDHLHADAGYLDRQTVGQVVNDMTVELPRAADFMFSHVVFLGIVGIIGFYLLGLLALSATMTLTALAVFGAAFVFLRRQIGQAEQVGQRMTRANQDMGGFIVERLPLTRFIRLKGMERTEIGVMAALNERQKSTLVRLQLLMANVEVIMEPLVVGAAFVFLYVSVAVLEAPLSSIGVFLVVVMRLLPVIKALARTRQLMKSLAPSYEAVSARLAQAQAAREATGGSTPISGVTRGIDFASVGFKYREDGPPALDGLTISIPAGAMTAIVGPSGAGKSTLVDMIPRLRRPDSGRIEIDGVSIDEFDVSALRRAIAYVPQVPQIFDVGIAEHIRYGRPEATFDEIVAAARLAGADEFIRALPQGYETRCGPGGQALSGGQRQRLDLARALARRAPILILDEPSSSLDAESEHRLRLALERIRENCETTMIVIAHRLSTVIMADQIAVMAKGAVIAQGRHQQLLAMNGWYAEAFRRQTEFDDAEHAERPRAARTRA